MSKLFLFSLTEFLSRISLDFTVVMIDARIILASLICALLSVLKREYGLRKRLWLAVFMVGVSLIQLWIELSVFYQVKHLLLTAGICVCMLAIILFLPTRKNEITAPQRDLARFISKKAKIQTQSASTDYGGKEMEVFTSPIIKAQPQITPVNDKKEIEFSHVKSVINKLEYYPLKEQDKKQAKELENAILSAEQNGITLELKEKINDGLGALLKIMSKYAV